MATKSLDGSHTLTPSLPITQNQPKITIIRLVDGKNTSRPFLHILEEQHITTPNFDALINPNPFRKYSSSPATAKSEPEQLSFTTLTPSNKTNYSKSLMSISRRKSSVRTPSPSKERSKSRFSFFASKNDCTFGAIEPKAFSDAVCFLLGSDNNSITKIKLGPDDFNLINQRNLKKFEVLLLGFSVHFV